MNFKVQVRRAAELDVAEAQVWYETQRSGLGAEFHSEISHIFTVLAETPLMYPILHRDVRRVLVHPYLMLTMVISIHTVRIKNLPRYSLRSMPLMDQGAHDNSLVVGSLLVRLNEMSAVQREECPLFLAGN